MWDRACPAGHQGPFTQFGLSIYSCHQCSPTYEHKFYLNLGVALWTNPERVPVGLLKMAEERASQRRQNSDAQGGVRI